MQSCQLAAGPEQKELGRKWGNFSRYWGTVWDGAEGLLFFAEFFAFKKTVLLILLTIFFLYCGKKHTI